jgi:hypothetical protein
MPKSHRSNRLAGMTVNERLFELGLVDMWNLAARARDRDAMIRLIKQCEVETAERTVDAILNNPKKYGF